MMRSPSSKVSLPTRRPQVSHGSSYGPSRLLGLAEARIPTWRGDIRVECPCGAEYYARTGQLVKEPICGFLSARDWPGPRSGIETLPSMAPELGRLAGVLRLRVALPDRPLLGLEGRGGSDLGARDQPADGLGIDVDPPVVGRR
jgi:hypothetical protein